MSGHVAILCLRRPHTLCKHLPGTQYNSRNLHHRHLQVTAYLFNGYWEDIGTIKSFFDANLALAQQPPRFEFYDPNQPIYTSPRFLPPAKIIDCKVQDAIVSPGSFLEKCTVENAIIGLRSRVDQGVTIRVRRGLGGPLK